MDEATRRWLEAEDKAFEEEMRLAEKRREERRKASKLRLPDMTGTTTTSNSDKKRG